MENVKFEENKVDNQNENTKKFNWKKAGGILGNVLLYTFLVFCLFTVVISVFLKKNSDGAVTVFGHQLRIVVSDSMAKCDETYNSIKKYKIKDIPVKSLVIVKVMPDDEAKADKWYENIKEGDVLTFRYTYTKQETITHRVVSSKRNPNGDGWIITLKGDNKASANSETLEQVIDTSIPNNTNYVIGKVVGTSYFLGSILTFIKQPLGIFLLIIIPCLIIIIMEVIRLVNFFAEEKKEKLESENQKNKDEIEELKKKLALLEQGLIAKNEVQSSEKVVEESKETTNELSVEIDENLNKEPEKEDTNVSNISVEEKNEDNEIKKEPETLNDNIEKVEEKIEIKEDKENLSNDSENSVAKKVDMQEKSKTEKKTTPRKTNSSSKSNSTKQSNASKSGQKRQTNSTRKTQNTTKKTTNSANKSTNSTKKDVNN